MGNLPNWIELDIDEVKPIRGTTIPRLAIELEASSSNKPVNIEAVNAEADFRFESGNTHISGPIPHVPLAQVQEISRQGLAFQAIVELDRSSLDAIEELRNGGDVELDLSIWMVGSLNDNRESGSFDISVSIIDAQWNRILDAFDYHDSRQVRLSLSVDDPKIRDRLATASAKIDSAEHKHDLGDYPATVVACRRAIEALRSIEEVEGVLDKRKFEDVDGVMGKFEKGFAGGLAHAEEKTSNEPAMRRDSEFALNFTKACARYISIALEESA